VEFSINVVVACRIFEPSSGLFASFFALFLSFSRHFYALFAVDTREMPNPKISCKDDATLAIFSQAPFLALLVMPFLDVQSLLRFGSSNIHHYNLTFEEFQGRLELMRRMSFRIRLLLGEPTNGIESVVTAATYELALTMRDKVCKRLTVPGKDNPYLTHEDWKRLTVLPRSLYFSNIDRDALPEYDHEDLIRRMLFRAFGMDITDDSDGTPWLVRVCAAFPPFLENIRKNMRARAYLDLDNEDMHHELANEMEELDNHVQEFLESLA